MENYYPSFFDEQFRKQILQDIKDIETKRKRTIARENELKSSHHFELIIYPGSNLQTNVLFKTIEEINALGLKCKLYDLPHKIIEKNKHLKETTQCLIL